MGIVVICMVLNWYAMWPVMAAVASYRPAALCESRAVVCIELGCCGLLWLRSELVCEGRQSGCAEIRAGDLTWPSIVVLRVTLHAALTVTCALLN